MHQLHCHPATRAERAQEIGGDGSGFPRESEVARLQGPFESEARRVRTADLLGAMQSSEIWATISKSVINRGFVGLGDRIASRRFVVDYAGICGCSYVKWPPPICRESGTPGEKCPKSAQGGWSAPRLDSSSPTGYRRLDPVAPAAE
jgi:hypothetical protein